MMKKLLFVLLVLPCLFFGQEYSFDYELDYRKANGQKRRVGKMMISLEKNASILQLYKPNKNYFACIRDFEKKQRHYFYYRSNKKGEKYEYIGTVKWSNEMDDFINVSKVSSSEYPEIEYIIRLHPEFGKNFYYFINGENNYEKNENKVINYKLKTKTEGVPEEINLNYAPKKSTKIMLPNQLKFIPFEQIQILTMNVVTKDTNALKKFGEFRKQF